MLVEEGGVERDLLVLPVPVQQVRPEIVGWGRKREPSACDWTRVRSRSVSVTGTGNTAGASTASPEILSRPIPDDSPCLTSRLISSTCSRIRASRWSPLAMTADSMARATRLRMG